MKVIMLETKRGASGRFDMRQYHEGEVYDLTGDLLRNFLWWGYAEKVDG